MSEKINRLIPCAMQAIETSGMMKEDRSVPAEYKGYIAAMSTSINQAGLLPSITFYTRGTRDDTENTGKAEDTNKLLQAIFDLIKKQRTDEAIVQSSLLTYVLECCSINLNREDAVKLSDLNMDKLILVQEDVHDALYALKLALRTFELKKSES